MARLEDPKPLLGALGALLLATALVLGADRRLEGPRLANLDVGGSEIPAVYVNLDPRTPDRCFVTDRQGSTLRRDDDAAGRRKWTCRRGAGESATGNLPSWLLHSKREKTLLLVPVDGVRDWVYPYLYAFVREEGGETTIPRLGWQRLFVNRIYHGLYLQVDFPANAEGDGNAPPAVEFLSVVDGSLGCLDDALDTPCREFPTLIAGGRLPELAPPSPLVAWLIERSPVSERLAQMEALAPFRTHWLPLAVSLRDSYREVRGRALPLTLDQRWSQLAQEADLKQADLTELLVPSERETLRAGLGAYRRTFAEALAVHCETHQCAGTMSVDLTTRLDEPARVALDEGEAHP